MAKRKEVDPIIEDALYIKDRISANKDTKELMQWIYARLETRAAMVAADMAEGTKEDGRDIYNANGEYVTTEFDTIPLTHVDYCRMSGMWVGLRWLRGEIESLIMKANEHERVQGEKGGE